MGVSGTGPFTYQWQFNSNNVANIIATFAGGGTQNPGDGGAAVNASLNTVNDVVVTGPYGSVTSSNATITVGFGPGIVAPPQSQAALIGGNVTFSVTANGTAPFFYQWYFNAAPLPGQTNTTLVVNNITTNNAGDCQVVVNNLYGSVTSSIAALSVVTPGLQSTSQTIVAGSSATLSVTIAGAGPLSYQWQCNGTNLPNSVITTVAGNVTNGFSGDGGAATNANLASPYCVALDASGNLFIADTGNNRIRKVGTNGVITTVAGRVGYAFSGDGGPATNACLDAPSGLALDTSGNLYIADSVHSRVREVGTNGIITTVVGNGGYTYTGGGVVATNSAIAGPAGLAVDAYGNLFIADGSSRILEVDINSIINTVAGNGAMSYSGDGGAAINASLNQPDGVALDAYGEFFIADNYNQCIRKVGANGIITSATPSFSLNHPYSLAADAYGDLFIADTSNHRIREMKASGILTTVAGTGTGGYSGDGGTAINASLNQPYGVAIDAYGNLFIADTHNNCIREVVFQGPNLVLTNVATNNAGSYDVVVTSSHGSVTSSVIAVTVLLPPQNLSASMSIGEGVQFQFTGTPGSNYVLQAATDLTPPVNWQPVLTNYADTNGNWSFIDTNMLANPALFYRAMLQ